MARKVSSIDPATEFLVSTLAGVVAEMIEAKCQQLNKHERNTLERQIRRAIGSFVQGMPLSREQQHSEAHRESLRRTRK
jgi:hypothetical protein